MQARMSGVHCQVKEKQIHLKAHMGPKLHAGHSVAHQLSELWIRFAV